MSIAKMNKLSVIGLESEKEAVLAGLQRLGTVQLIDQSDKLTDADWVSLIHKDSEEDRAAQLETELAGVDSVLDTVSKYDGEKKPLFFHRQAVSEKEFSGILGDGGAVRREVSELEGKIRQWNDMKSEENGIVSQQASLTPWASYTLPLDLTETRTVRVVTGVLPATADAEEMKRKAEEASDAVEIQILGQDGEQQYVSLLCMKQDEDAVMDAVKAFGFTPASFKGLSGTVSDNLGRLAGRLEEVKKEEKELEGQFVISPKEKKALRCYADELTVQRDRARAGEKMLATKKAFFLEGWVPEEAQTEVLKLLDAHDCWSEIREPEKGEETPTLLKPSEIKWLKWTYPVRSITELYSLPKSYEVDPTPIFAIFYIIFFGMMFADIAYGLILAGLTFFALKKYKPEGMANRLLTTLLYCGISTAIWGVLFGGFFGDLVPVKPMWMNPLDNAMFILAFSCILGVVHLFIGMGVKAYMQIKNGQVFDAFCDVFIWYIFLIGLGLLLFGDNYVFQGAGELGRDMAIIGAVVIVGCEFYRGKGIGKLLGLWNLYGTTSYLADILSYSRLLALGLASAVIAQVFNMLGRMVGKGVVGIIAFILILVVGHTVNFAINALGSFVHASRLQYVEFFGKFYEGGGAPFKPFTQDTKYVNIVNKEEK